MGTNEKILIGAVVLGAGVYGAIYVKKKGGFGKIFGKQEDETPKTTTNTSNYTRPVQSAIASNYTTPSSTRTRQIQQLLAAGGYMAASGVDGKWGKGTEAAFQAASAEKGLPKITDEASYRRWVSAFGGGGSGSGSGSGKSEIVKIAEFIKLELRDKVVDYSGIRDRLAPLTKQEVIALDKEYTANHGASSLLTTFKKRLALMGAWEVKFNLEAIISILEDSGLKGIENMNTLAGFVLNDY